MFINCKHCGTLVATDPVTDTPPERCPRCRGALRAAPAPAAVSVAHLLRAPVPTMTPGTEPASVATSTDTSHASAPVDAPAPPAAEAPRDALANADPAALPNEPGEADELAAASHAASVAAAAPPPAAVDTTLQQTLPAAATRTEVAPSRPVSPSFVRRVRAAGASTSQRQRRWLLGSIVALSLLLALQVLLADRARLGRDPGWRPLLSTLCGVLRCSLPAWREPAALTLLARDVRPDPKTASRLLVRATFRNDARWAQAWPHLRLTLSDVDGRAVGSRTFAPHEYLGDDAGASTLAAGHNAEVRLVLHEPEGRAVSFAFDFI